MLVRVTGIQCWLYQFAVIDYNAIVIRQFSSVFLCTALRYHIGFIKVISGSGRRFYVA